MAGTITADQFAVGAQCLAAAWNSHSSAQGSWHWTPAAAHANFQEAGCLGMQRPLASGNAGDSVHPGGPTLGQSLTCAADDDALPVQHLCDMGDHSARQDAAKPCRGIHMYKYHILYHSSYCVPIMMFKAYQPDGQLLPWEQILTDLPPLFSHAAAAHEQWTFVTQQDHPFEMTPWHVLHPCGTEHAMQLLMADVQHPRQGAERVATPGPRLEGCNHWHDAVYLLAWLSMVGPLVGLTVPSDLHSKLNQPCQHITCSR